MKAKSLMDIFKSTYIQLYGPFHATLTFHLLTEHLVEDTIRHGSPLGHSAYSLEGALGLITRSLNGTRGYSSQFIKSKKKIALFKYFLRVWKFF